VLPARAESGAVPALADSDIEPLDRQGEEGARWEGVDAQELEDPQQWCPGG
jgi:hypothetical protein